MQHMARAKAEQPLLTPFYLGNLSSKVRIYITAPFTAMYGGYKLE